MFYRPAFAYALFALLYVCSVVWLYDGSVGLKTLVLLIFAVPLAVSMEALIFLNGVLSEAGGSRVAAWLRLNHRYARYFFTALLFCALPILFSLGGADWCPSGRPIC